MEQGQKKNAQLQVWESDMAMYTLW